jgi:hypothetical protein
VSTVGIGIYFGVHPPIAPPTFGFVLDSFRTAYIQLILGEAGHLAADSACAKRHVGPPLATLLMAQQYHYVVTSQQPTVVSHSLVANFTSSEDKNLVIAKINRLEIHSISSSKVPAGHADSTDVIVVSDVLAPLFDVPIYGRIASLSKVRLATDSVDTLLLTTERYQLIALQFDSVARSIKTIASGDLRDRLGRPIDQGQLVSVDPLNRAVAFLFYDGILKVEHFPTISTS